ncbi:hypothetical protein [Bacillus sp. Bos-x628]|uniref:hypothetical protein n=1 Tax=Bacillus maqinnsis TaxID=3229854 RepID=UPI00338E45CA
MFGLDTVPAHLERVHRHDVNIARQEGGSLFIIELAAIVHDMIEEKLSNVLKLSKKQLLSVAFVDSGSTRHT